ncbi:DUF927 domain-containing protein, partial [Pseudomonas aeruginosa]|uniref:DUF927 domain-containing protein n=1 Tax=Pseudomonas aeruginosa TaxID=287 RepID=UPI002E79A210
FAVSLAFAAPLLKLVGIGGGGYHLKGESTDGKTTTMKVAASVCGGTDFWHTWRATGNALEGTASRRNDATLMLDGPSVRKLLRWYLESVHPEQRRGIYGPRTG